MIAMDPYRMERLDPLFNWRWLFYELLVWEREQRYQRALRYVEMGEDSSDNSGDEVISYDIGDDFEVVD